MESNFGGTNMDNRDRLAIGPQLPFEQWTDHLSRTLADIFT